MPICSLVGDDFGNAALKRRRIFELSFECLPPMFNAPMLPKSICTVMASGRGSGGYDGWAVPNRRRKWPVFTKEHIDWIATNQPEFYRRHFPGMVAAAGHGSPDMAFMKRRKDLGMVGTTKFARVGSRVRHNPYPLRNCYPTPPPPEPVHPVGLRPNGLAMPPCGSYRYDHPRPDTQQARLSSGTVSAGPSVRMPAAGCTSATGTATPVSLAWSGLTRVGCTISTVG